MKSHRSGSQTLVSLQIIVRLSLVALNVGLLLTGVEAKPRMLWKINADGTGLKQFAGGPETRCGSPDWSPDGKYIAFDTWQDKAPNSSPAVQIGVVRADGTDLRLLGHGAMPSWSPDGKQIVCHTYDNPNTCVVMNADGSGRETILNHWGSPRWSPRGNRIASILNGNIALYDLATAKERVILPGAYSVHYGFAISPDGARFCFGGRSGDLYLATLDEQKMTAAVQPIMQSGMSHHASFAPDGKRIAFGWEPKEAKFSQLYILDVDAKASTVQIKGQDTTHHNCDPDWSPDGKTIVFSSEP